LSETFCDVVVRRWQAFTGKAASLNGDGRIYDEIAAERAPTDSPAEDNAAP